MKASEIIQQELTGIAPQLENVSREMPFAVPENYFDTLSLEVLGKTVKPVKPEVQEGYFETFSANLLSKIKGMAANDELDEIAPALSKLSKKMPFTVPAAYFETLQVSHEKNEAPVVPISRNFTAVKWMVAAAVVVFAGFFAWQSLYTAPPVATVPVTAAVSPDHIDTEFANALAGIEESTINSELKENATTGNSLAAMFYLQTENFEHALGQLSEEEIKHQLDELVIVKNKS